LLIFLFLFLNTFF